MSAELLRLRPYQRAAIDAVWAAHASGMKRPAVVLATGSGKAQPVDEPVLTPTGWKKIGELSVGDRVIGSSGGPTTVTGVFPQGVRPTVCVEFTDGTSVRCDTDHLWSVQTRFQKHDSKRRGSDAWRTMTATEIRDSGLELFVPVVAPVHFDEGPELPLDPYLLGVLLGDGGLSIPGQVRLHTRHDIIPLLNLPEGHRTTLYADQGVMGNYYVASRQGCSANLVMDALRELDLHGRTSHWKFIPEMYLRAATGDRLALLQGLFDTDGSAARNGVDFVSVSEELARGVAELVRSLGGRATVSYKRTSWTHDGQKKTGHAWRVYATLPIGMEPFRVERKASARLGGQQFNPTKRIKSVTPGPDLECVCISVESPDHLYVTTDYAVTHNTVIMSHAVREYRSRTAQRAMILVHREELADQTLAKLRAVAPHLKAGKVKAGDDDVNADVVVASVQTVSRPARLERLLASQQRSGRIGFVLTDECHHAVAASYRTVYDAFPDADHLGVTATMARGDGAGLGRVWHDVVFQRSVLRMIADGYLSDVRGIAVATDLDLSTVKRSGGDYSAGSLGAAMMEVDAHKVVAKAMLQHARDRHSIVFTPTVAVAEETARELTVVGIPAAFVSGATPTEERHRAYAAFEAGRLRALVNCAVLTEGFDSPRTDCVVVARPTRSAGLYVQMAGRALRLYPGKTDALILDVSGTGGSLASIIDLSDEEAPVRSMRDGETLTEAAAREEAEADAPVKAGSVRFAIKHREMDLFAASSTAWLRTPAGVMFIETRVGQVFLWPSKKEPGQWIIGLAPGQNRPLKVLRDGASFPLGTAMAWAETDAEDLSDFSLERKASWRKKPANDGQRTYYRSRYGGQLPDRLSAGELSDLIAVAEAARKFDHKLTGAKR